MIEALPDPKIRCHDDAVALRYDLTAGTVYVVVWPNRGPDEDIAHVAVYEAAAAKADPNKIALGMYPEEAAARNKFGTGIMLRLLRDVKAWFPHVRLWLHSRVSGAKVGA